MRRSPPGFLRRGCPEGCVFVTALFTDQRVLAQGVIGTAPWNRGRCDWDPGSSRAVPRNGVLWGKERRPPMWKNLRQSRHMPPKTAYRVLGRKCTNRGPRTFCFTRELSASRVWTLGALALLQMVRSPRPLRSPPSAAVGCGALADRAARWLIELRNPVRDDEELDDAFSGFMIERRRAQEKERLRGVEQQRIQKRNAQRRPSPSHFTVAAPPRGPWAGNAG